VERSSKTTKPPEGVTYAVSTLPRAEKALAKLPKDARERIGKAIDGLEHEPRPHGSKKLATREAFRIRIGNHRVVYEIDDAKKTVTVLDVGDRKEIYR
jgi:mRNA interferase RelE/StbE